jgi:hypothetical protein
MTMATVARDLTTGSDYHFPVTDPFTPTAEQAPPLAGNISNPALWGETVEDYVQWFNRLWQTGDPSGWGPQDFTPDAVMIDATGTSTGAAQAAADFLLLFQYFPNLRGEVVSWAANDTEIMINWRFLPSANQTVPVIDKFSFRGGLVSFRQAYFDTFNFLSYLAENYGSGPLVDYFVDRFWHSETGRGHLFTPGLVWALVKGVFFWSEVPPAAPANVSATAGNGQVTLRWNPVPGATSYRVTRADSIDGQYHWIAPVVPNPPFVDTTAANGTKWFYKICANTQATPPPPQPDK